MFLGVFVDCKSSAAPTQYQVCLLAADLALLRMSSLKCSSAWSRWFLIMSMRLLMCSGSTTCYLEEVMMVPKNWLIRIQGVHVHPLAPACGRPICSCFETTKCAATCKNGRHVTGCIGSSKITQPFVGQLLGLLRLFHFSSELPSA